MHPTAMPALQRYVLLPMFLIFSTQILAAQSGHTVEGGLRSEIGVRGIVFTPNLGQVADNSGALRPDLLFISSGPGVSLYLGANRISYVYQRIEGDVQAWRSCDHGTQDEDGHSIYVAEPIIHSYRMDMELVGANPSPRVLTSHAADGYTNYYLPHIPNGVTNVPSYGTLVYRDVYSGIDMVLRGSAMGMKCDFVVHPGARPSDIRMRYVGADRVDLAHGGSLLITNPLGELTEEAPYSYQPQPLIAGTDPYAIDRSLFDTNGSEDVILSSYVVEGDDVRFFVGGYDPSRVLVIDPTRKWATFYGGTGTEDMNGGDATEVDRTGNVLFTGSTNNATFPTTTGAFQTALSGLTDVVVVKMRSNGTRLWATLYGGTRDDLAHGIGSDNNRNVFLAGHTFSTNFPVLNAHQSSAGGGFGQRDAFVIKFDSNGTRQWATYIGGSGFDDAYGFAIDSTGNPAVVATTSSTTAIATTGAYDVSYAGGYDACLVKFNGNGVRQWGTYFGGGSEEYGYAAATDINDNIIVSGWTESSTGFPVLNAYQGSLSGGDDAFVTKFSSSGTLIFSTYYGGGGLENDDPITIGFSAVATDGVGNIFITGFTASADFPVSTSGLQRLLSAGTGRNGYDAYIVKFDTVGNRLWATYHGGSGEDIGQGIASSPSGAVLITGHTTSNNFPGITADAYQPGRSGNKDAFVVKINSAGTAYVYATYYGGTSDDEGVGISFDPFGSIVFAGQTYSTNFPVTAGAYQGTCASCVGSPDAFVSLFCDIEPGVIDSSGPLTFCRGDSVTLSVEDGYSSYLWSTGESGTSITVATPDRYWVKITNGADCEAWSDTLIVRWFDEPNPVITPGGNLQRCAGDSVLLEITRAASARPFAKYSWYDASLTTLIQEGPYNPYRRLLVKTSGNFRVIVQDTTGCLDTSLPVTITFNPLPAAVSITPTDTVETCEGVGIPLHADRAQVAGESFVWSNGQSGASITPTVTGNYRLVVRTVAGCSTVSNTVHVKVNPKPRPPIYANPSPAFCEGDSVLLETLGGYVTYEWSTGSSTSRTYVKNGGEVTLRIVDTNGCENTVAYSVIKVARPSPTIAVNGSRTICDGDSVTLDAGVGYSMYRWSTGEGTQRITVRDSGSYWVQVEEPTANCSGVSDTVHIAVNPRPAAIVSGPVAVCVSTITDYTVQAQTGASYLWTIIGGGGTLTTPADRPSISVQWGSVAGIGRVRVRVTFDSSGCYRDTTIDVTIGSGLVPSIATSRSTNLCPGDSVTLDAGSGYTSYAWRNPGGTVIGSGRSITVNTAGIYTVSVSKDNCSGDASVDVREVDLPTPVITVFSGDTVLCPGGAAVLDGGPYRKWTWIGPSGNAGSVRRITVVDSGLYVVTVEDSNGCVGVSKAVRVRIDTPVKPVISGPASVCIGSTENYSIPTQLGADVLWTITGGVGTVVGANNMDIVTINWTAAGSGVVSVSRTSTVTGCVATSDPLSVTVGSSVTPAITTSGATAICDGDSLVLYAPSGYTTYAWSDGSGTPLGNDTAIVIRTAGRYQLVVASGACSGSSEIVIDQRPPVVPLVSPSGIAGVCAGDSIELVCAPVWASYRWSNGDTTSSIWVKSAGAYSVTAYDASGCFGASEVVNVIMYALPVPAITATGDNLTSTPARGYQWNLDGTPISGATDVNWTARSNGSYTVTVTDSNGCSATSAAVDVFGAAIATVKIGSYEASPGEHITIPLELVASQGLDRNGVASFTATLKFNRTLLIPAFAFDASSYNGNDRILRISGTLPTAVTGGTSLRDLEFIAALGAVEKTPITIETFIFTEDTNVAITRVDGEFSLAGICREGPVRLLTSSGSTKLSAIRPNPANGNAVIEYELVEVGSTRLYLVNMTGARVPIFDGMMAPGAYSARVELSGLPSGAYICVLETPTERLTTIVRVEH